MIELKENACAKINLTLDITGTLPDGYHALETVMQTVSLRDRVTLRKTQFGITLQCTDSTLPTGSDNLTYRAAERFFSEYKVSGGVRLHLEKNIPSQAGLGGGSADAAAVLRGLNRLYETNLSAEMLERTAASLGADVPFCICGGTTLCKGKGELLTPVGRMPECVMVIAKPSLGISTADAYAAFDSSLNDLRRPDNPKLIKYLNDGKATVRNVSNLLCNVFEQALPTAEISELIRKLTGMGAVGACMSGSGSAVFSLYNDEDKAREACDCIKKSGMFACICHPVGRLRI